MDELSNKKLNELKETIPVDTIEATQPVKRRKSLFLSLDKIEEWEKSFHFAPKEVRDLALKRNEFRLQRLFKEADEIKERIWDLGWGLRDSESWVYLYRRRFFNIEPVSDL